MRKCVAVTAAILLDCVACSAPHRQLSIAPTLPSCLDGAAVNTVRISALGDFPPQAALTAAASSTAPATLDLPRATRVVAVEGFGPLGLAAFGRTAPLSLDDVGGDTLGVAYGPPDGLCATGTMQVARVGHRLTRLASGAVLVTGGFDGAGPATAIELYRPNGSGSTPAASFALAPSALTEGAVVAHAAVALADGGALVVGGAATGDDGAPHGRAFAGATRYDADGKQVGPPKLLLGGTRAAHTATVLRDGRVLIVGGCAEFDASGCRAGEALGTTELYDPDADLFVAGPPLLRARWDHDAVLRGDGTILLVGGRGESGGALPAEVVDPDEFRSFDAGLTSGHAAALGTGSVLVAGGAAAPDAAVTLWLAPAEPPLALPALGEPRRAPTLTPLDDGGVLLAGGGTGPLYVYDGRGAVTALPTTTFSRSGHAATRLDDGTVLLAGGADESGVPTASAALYFRSPLSAWSSLPPLTLDGPADPYLPRRPDRALAAAGQLLVTAPTTATGGGGRPAELALVAGMEVADFGFDLLAGRHGPAGGALIVGWRSEAAFDFVVVEPGRAVELWTVTSPRAGQSVPAPVAGCRGAIVDDSALPDGDLSPLHVDWRGGTRAVTVAGQTVLSCRPPALSRGRVGVGALHGTVAFDNLALVR